MYATEQILGKGEKEVLTAVYLYTTNTPDGTHRGDTATPTRGTTPTNYARTGGSTLPSRASKHTQTQCLKVHPPERNKLII